MSFQTRLLVGLLFEVFVVVAVVAGLSLLVVVGPSRLRERSGDVRQRFREGLAAIALVLGVLLVNRFLRPIVPELSWAFGIPITDAIYRFEGTFVVWVQSFARPWLTSYLAFAYVHLYVFLLFVPFLVYLFAADARPLRVAGIAYAANYGIGVVCYVIFIAYGPRNYLVEEVDSLLYTTYPTIRLLTQQANVNTNAFPSLHTSMAVTVALLSLWTRDQFPRFPILVIPMTLSIVLATMYLGLHWVTDVLGGIVLAGIATGIGVRWTARGSE